MKSLLTSESLKLGDLLMESGDVAVTFLPLLKRDNMLIISDFLGELRACTPHMMRFSAT